MRQNKGGSGDLLYTFNSNNVLDIGVSVTQYGEGNVKPIIVNGSAKEAGFPASYQDQLGGYHDLPAVFVNTYTVNNGGLTYPGLSQIGTTGQVDRQDDHHLEIAHPEVRIRRAPLLVRRAGSRRLSYRLLQLRQ